MRKNVPMFRIEFTSQFTKQRKAVSLQVKGAFRETLELFLENPTQPLLRRHFLKGEYNGYESIDVTPDYRAIFKERKTKTSIRITFYLLGTHQELYGIEKKGMR